MKVAKSTPEVLVADAGDIAADSGATMTGPDRESRPSLDRESILKVAADLFRQKSFRATSLQEVADVFGVQRPALYYYFDSKAEILIEIHDRLLAALMAELEPVRASDASPDEKLRAVLEGQIRTYAENIAELAVFIENETELPEDVYSKARQEKREYGAMIEEIYREGVAEGSFVDVDPKIAVFALIGMTNWMYRWYNRDGSYTIDDLAEIITMLARNGYARK